MKTRELNETYKAQEASKSYGINRAIAHLIKLYAAAGKTGWLEARGEAGTQFELSPMLGWVFWRCSSLKSPVL